MILKVIEYDDNLRFASFYISNMYTHVPNIELLKIICTQMKYNIFTRKAILEFCKIILNQIYFQQDGKLCIQTDGLVVGFPISRVCLEIRLSVWNTPKLLIF
jgi:hypothetical protein